MTDLAHSLVLVLVAGPLLALTGLLLHPIWSPLAGVLDKFAAPITGALEGMEQGTHDLQSYLRSVLRSSTRWFLYGDSSKKPVPGWPLRYVIKPLLAFVICVALLLIELDLGALGWQAALGTGSIPDLHLPLSLLMGMMLPLAGIAFAEALFDALDERPAGAWSIFSPKGRRVVAVLIGLGLVACVVANVFFFAWRFGQLGGTNHYAYFGAPTNFVLGALLCLGPVVAGAVGFRFVAILVPVFLTVACGLLLVVEKAAQVVRIALEAVEAVGKFLLTCLTMLGEQLKKVLDACGSAVSTTITAFADRIRPEHPKPPIGDGPKPPRHRRCMFFVYLGRAILEATRAFWRLLHDVVHGLGNACLGIGRLVVAIFCGIGRGIRVAAIGVGHAARAVGLGLGRAATAVGRAIWTCVVGIARAVVRTTTALGRAAVATVKPVLLLAVAIAIWLFYWPARIVWSFLRWLCRFEFWSKRMHFNALPGPPPKERMDRRLGLLASHDEDASGIIFGPIRTNPSAHRPERQTP